MVQKARAPTRAFALQAPIVEPLARPGQHAAHPDDGHQSGELALHRLSTGAHNLPVSPLDPPRPPVPVWRLRPTHHAVTTTVFHLVKRFGGGPRSSPDSRAS